MAKVQMSGVMTSTLTPFNENGGVDYVAHAENLERWNQSRLSGYLVLGAGSEAEHLSEKEKIQLMELTVRHSIEERFILAGADPGSAVEIVAFANLAVDLGINGVLVKTPSRYDGGMNEKAVMEFYSWVADHTKIPIFIYACSGSGRYGIPAGVAGELSLHPNVLGMIDGTGDAKKLAEFKMTVADDFNLIVGSAASWYQALGLGIRAGVFTVANCAPDEMAEIQELYECGKIDEASGIHRRIFAVDTALASAYGITGLKYAVDLLGYRGGRARGSVRQLTDEQKADIRRALETVGLL